MARTCKSAGATNEVSRMEQDRRLCGVCCCEGWFVSISFGGRPVDEAALPAAWCLRHNFLPPPVAQHIADMDRHG
jgi:hypothetical protein